MSLRGESCELVNDGACFYSLLQISCQCLSLTHSGKQLGDMKGQEEVPSFSISTC